jgi:Mpv17 / PMP22 family
MENRLIGAVAAGLAPADPLWRPTLRAALAALHDQWRPLLVLNLLVAALVAGEFLSADFAARLDTASAWLMAGGLPAVFLAAGLSSGMLAEIAVVVAKQGGRWRAVNTEGSAVRFAVFGVNAVVVSLFYRVQAYLFGDGLGWSVQLPKLAVDQLLFAPLVCLPLQITASRLHALRFDARRLATELCGPFLRKHYLPALATQWLFWPPVSLAIYLFPLPLQTPLFLLIGAAWALLMATLAR